MEEMVTLVMSSRPKIINAQTRIVHGKPILGIRRTTIRGKMTPPRDEPAIVKPPARARFLRKNVMGYRCSQSLIYFYRCVEIPLTAVILGVKTREAPIPEQTDWLSAN